ncbi:DUF92 domain-containing protein [Candidatus Xianfuyuplasma coldseepsis]|uniref:DUF92 domain-containing protein n=1 Tax=Candidatus Xianfuyuplasma coldseepsis TaxID=2782163 RepID=A0A7L7KRN1_9MOLU|nr:DUF92 domain-containing protein [Xianfuyuplasma coldseepsis]QMS85481.1 DUF92 domain-containing protein [Xianfuyuplasma coldseepsis]
MEFIAEHMTELIIGMVVASSISIFAYVKQSLSLSGMIAAWILGVVVTVCGGYLSMSAMLVFFISSSLFTKLHKEEKKHSPRTAYQVLANGGIAMVLSVLHAIDNNAGFQLLFFLSLSISTADTWASEIGTLSPHKPRHIITLQQLQTGEDGGVTWIGFIASLAGSIVISLFYQLHWIIIAGGFLGSIVDSLLGTIQRTYQLDNQVIVNHLEQNQVAMSSRGIPYLTNSVVNFLSNLIVVTVVYLLFLVL